MSKSAAQISRELDEAAREAGIQISRYQQPLDLTRMKIKSDPTLFAAKFEPDSDTTSSTPFVAPSTTTTTTTTPLQPSQIRENRSFHDLIAPTDQASLIHQLPTSISPTSRTAPSTAPQPQQATTDQPKPTKSAHKSAQKLNQSRPPQIITKKQQPTLPSLTNTAQSQVNSNKDKDGFTVEEKNAKAAEFFRIIETKLAPELKHHQDCREKAARDLHDYEQLIQTIHGLRLAKQNGQKTIESKVDLGCKVLAEAKFVNNGAIMIDIGLGLFVEMKYDEALEHIKVKCGTLHKVLTAAEDQCCLWSARIKSMHEAIGVLTQISEAPEELPSLRDVYFQ